MQRHAGTKVLADFQICIIVPFVVVEGNDQNIISI